MADTTEDINWLRKKARDWALKVVEVYNTPVPPELQADKQKLLDRARWLKDKIEMITGTLEEFAPLRSTIGGLGIWPVIIGVVGVAAAAAYIGYWILDYNKFMEKVSLQRAMVSDGMSQQQAASMTQKLLGETSLAEKILNPKAFVPLGILAVVGMYLWHSD